MVPHIESRNRQKKKKRSIYELSFTLNDCLSTIPKLKLNPNTNRANCQEKIQKFIGHSSGIRVSSTDPSPDSKNINYFNYISGLKVIKESIEIILSILSLTKDSLYST